MRVARLRLLRASVVKRQLFGSHDRWAAADLGIAEAGRVGHHDQVAGQGQAGAAGQGVAVDRGDGRPGEAMDLVDQVGDRLGVVDGLLVRAALLPHSASGRSPA